MNQQGAWLLAQPLPGVQLLAEPVGVVLRGTPLVGDNYRALNQLPATSRLGKLLPTLLPQLLELDLAAREDGAIIVAWEDFVALNDHRIDAFDDLVAASPFALEIQTSGSLGLDNFRYDYSFYLGVEPAHPARLGCFLKRGSQLYRLDRQAWALIEAVQAFNALPPEQKRSAQAFVKFAHVKGLGEGVGAQLDQFILREKVIVPAKVGLDLIVDDDGRISFAPQIEGVPDSAMRRAFMAFNDVEGLYSVDDGSGGQVRVVFDTEQREALRRMQRARHLGGADRARVLADPAALFDGVVNAVTIDPALYGPRVKGIGDFPFVAQPFLRRAGLQIFDGPAALGQAVPTAPPQDVAGIECKYVDGSSESVEFASPEELLDLHQRAERAYASGQGTVEFRGKTLPVDHHLIGALRELRDHTEASRSDAPEKQRRFLLIYTNDQELDFTLTLAERALLAQRSLPEVPAALNSTVRLKEHQRDGLAWLQRNYLLKRGGCLLADDMGLGKTLQALAFLAWLIGEAENWPAAAPWSPMLIVCPLILMDEQGPWLGDMRRCFTANGSIFEPSLCLHGATLQKFKRHAGVEVELGEPTLDLEELRRYRLILTNYETLTNYQHSFARMKENWSVVVTDEAQAYKTPNTRISHALKSLAPRFRVALTGTPVETRLLDIWNIFDFLQPGGLLGSAKEFSSAYENAAEDEDNMRSDQRRVGQLKQRLRFGAQDAYILRREKGALGGALPPKREMTIDCELSTIQRHRHLELAAAARAARGEARIGFISHLMRLYQHPALVPRYEPLATADAVALCPKLAAVLDTLREIRRKREKALIFTHHLDMQQILAQVLGDEFNLNVAIVNGQTPRTGGRSSGTATRDQLLRRFRESSGFDVIVLAPEVAGIGLTLTEANHVIHYGRWWNPAREAQATDRVYRIGQTREVLVYHPIARDPSGEFVTFDQKLDALLARRRALASEFLAPIAAEKELQAELVNDVLGEAAIPQTSAEQPLTPEEISRFSTTHVAALAALIKERQGAAVILTPISNEGIDVIAFKDGTLSLAKCWPDAGEIGPDGVEQLLNACAGYRARRLTQNLKEKPLRPTMFIKGRLSTAGRKLAVQRGVQIADLSEISRLAAGLRCTGTEVEAMEFRRLSSMGEICLAMESLPNQ